MGPSMLMDPHQQPTACSLSTTTGSNQAKGKVWTYFAQEVWGGWCQVTTYLFLFFYVSLFKSESNNMLIAIICRWLDLNRGPLVSQRPLCQLSHDHCPKYLGQFIQLLTLRNQFWTSCWIFFSLDVVLIRCGFLEFCFWKGKWRHLVRREKI